MDISDVLNLHDFNISKGSNNSQQRFALLQTCRYRILKTHRGERKSYTDILTDLLTEYLLLIDIRTSSYAQ